MSTRVNCATCGVEFVRRGHGSEAAKWCSMACRRSATDASVVGRAFEALTCVGRTDDGAAFLCRCECGTVVRRYAYALLDGSAKCCGCKVSTRASERKREDLAGRRFGRWTVAAWSHVNKRTSYWKCVCDCGSESTVPGKNLVRGYSKSCGCNARDVTANRNRKHGEAQRGAKTPEYSVWISMRRRCDSPTAKAYANYGGRGIRVCERWASFENFAKDMGPRQPGKSIERIDVNGDYEPRNCRWATALEQGANKRNNVMVCADGVSLHVAEWSRVTGLNRRTIEARLHRGDSGASALRPLPQSP